MWPWMWVCHTNTLRPQKQKILQKQMVVERYYDFNTFPLREKACAHGMLCWIHTEKSGNNCSH